MTNKSWYRFAIALLLSLVLLLVGLRTLQAPLPSSAHPEQTAFAPGDVVINEVAWMGTAASYNHEWIELYNTTNQDIDLTGWTLIAEDGTPNITLNGIIPAYGYFLLERTSDNTISDIPADQIYTGPLGNDPGAEILVLRDTSNQIIDTANGDGGPWPAGNNTTKQTMERIDPLAPDTDDNWEDNDGVIRNGLDANGDPLNGTPRCRNSAASPLADLTVGLTGPATLDPGAEFSYVLTLRNSGNLTATDTRLTNTLPAEVRLLDQQSPFAFTQLDAQTLVWDVGAFSVSGGETYITLTVALSDTATSLLVNVFTVATATPEVTTFNNTAVVTTTFAVPEPVLTLTKLGPSVLAPNQTATYHVVLSNTGTLTATGIVVTDTLPGALEFITQTSAYPFSHDGQILRWEIAALPMDTRATLTFTVMTRDIATDTVTNYVIAADSLGTALSASTTASVLPYVRLYALHPVNSEGSKESVALINQSEQTVSLAGWCIDDRVVSTSRACFPEGAEIAPEQILWMAEDADGFYLGWGFDADWTSTVISRTGISLLDGSWPGYTDDGEVVYLLEPSGLVVDVLAYGKGAPTEGWLGDALPYPSAGFNDSAQVIYRKLDQATGLPVPDTDTAADWAQDPNDLSDGRRLRYPGWDLEALFFPVEVAATHPVTLAVAPDAMLSLVLETVASAQETLVIEGYSLESIPLYEVISDRVASGVEVTILLEASPAGGMGNQQKWVLQQLAAREGVTIYFMGGAGSRYRFQHAKFILVDGRLALISSDNFGESSMPSDLIANGTMGHRGVVAVTTAPEIIERLQTIFDYDCDPEHHRDIISYSSDYAPPANYIPLPVPDWTTYTAPFSQTFATTADHFTLLHAPEHTLRDTDGLLGMIGRAGVGDTIAVMQMNEPLTWTQGIGELGLNRRIQMLVAAARRGAAVRILLDANYDDPTAPNKNTATCLYLNAISRAEGIMLNCRLGNVTGLGIHAKMFLAHVGGEYWVHLGSLNGTETSNKVNREVMLQIRSPEAHVYLLEVFEYDWGRSHGPMIFRINFPLVFNDYYLPATYPLITEVYINPPNAPGEPEDHKEWIEIYNPSLNQSYDLAGWLIGDAIAHGDYGDGRYRFPDNAGVLLPQQVIIVAGCATEFAATYGFNPNYEWLACDPNVTDLIPEGDWEGFGIALGNTTDEVLLHNAEGMLVDAVAWGGDPRLGVLPYLDYEPPFPTNASLERRPAHTDRNDCNRDFRMRFTPEPGQVRLR